MTQPRVAILEWPPGEGDDQNPPNGREKGMKKATRTKLSWIIILAVAAMVAAACQDLAKGPDHPAKAHGKCRTVISKSYVEGTSRRYLTLEGRRQPVRVSLRTFRSHGVGSRYCGAN